MRVLFISGEVIAGDLAYQLKKEGCDVKLYIEDEDGRDCFDGMVKKTGNWRKELKWVGKNGLIICDDVGFGSVLDDLRAKGFSVVGAGKDGERLEKDRDYAQKIMKQSGIKISDDFKTKTFTVGSAIAFVKKNKGTWVLKQNDHNNALTYIGKTEDGSDMINVLENYVAHGGSLKRRVTLQRKAYGVEIAIGRFFNGFDWIGPSVINFEHKHLNNDDIGPMGGETGTLMWYEKDENNKLFVNTLSKIKPHLQKIAFKGYIDLNCIIDGDKLYPLELTARFGSSTNQTQSELQVSPWKDILTAIARGKNFDVSYKSGYAVNVGLTVPPFPYRTSDEKLKQSGLNIYFGKELSKEDFSHIHYEGISIKKINRKVFYRTAGVLGYVLYITGSATDINVAREGVYRIIDKITIPNMMYRTDIGLRFLRKDKDLLKKWGWLS